MNIIFFGTPEFSKDVLDVLASHALIPTLIVTQEDKPVGRNMILTAPPVKVWADAHAVPCLQPKSLRNPDIQKEIASYGAFDVGIVASYGKILPPQILDLAQKGFLNIHPSLLPLHRGASPIHSSILSGDPFGVSIIVLDEEMDHGPIVAQKQIPIDILPSDAYRDTAEKVMAQVGAELLSEVLPDFISGKNKGLAQDHAHATFCGKITKADGEVDLLKDDPLTIVRKVRAFTGWPGTFFFTDYNTSRIRVQILEAHLENNILVITKVKPEGKKEMLYTDFLRGNRQLVK